MARRIRLAPNFNYLEFEPIEGTVLKRLPNASDIEKKTRFKSYEDLLSTMAGALQDACAQRASAMSRTGRNT